MKNKRFLYGGDTVTPILIMGAHLAMTSILKNSATFIAPFY